MLSDYYELSKNTNFSQFYNPCSTKFDFTINSLNISQVGSVDILNLPRFTYFNSKDDNITSEFKKLNKISHPNLCVPLDLIINYTGVNSTQTTL